MIRFFEARLRRALVTLPVILAIVIVPMPLSGCGLRDLAKPATWKRSQAPAPRVPSGAEKFAAASDSLTDALDEAHGAFANGSTPTTALADIRDFAKQLPALDKGVKADFKKTRKILKKIDSPEKDAIERKVEGQYASRLATLEKHLTRIESAQGQKATAAAVASAGKWLDSITPEEPYQPLGTELPHRIVDRKAGPPVLGTSIAPAYAPDTPGAEPSTLPVTPTAADTSETIEVQFTPEISSLVTSLGADPVRMYEYVRNTIDFEPYYGSRKGATETYLEGSGNDIDTASLLIALYRKAGIPARYVSGVVDIPIDEAMNWVGVEVPEAAAKLFSAGGTPTKLIISGGKPKALRIEHTWAEVYVDYEDYRGAGSGDGERVWVPLDASFKEYEETPQIDVGEYLTQAKRDAYASVLASATSADATGFVTIDYAAVSAATAMLTAEATAALAAAPEAQETTTLVGYRGPKLSHVGALPSTLGFAVRETEAEWVAVPDPLVTKLHLSVVSDSGETVLSYDAPLPQVGEGKIVLGFVPAGADDQSIRAAHTSIEDVAAYLMSTKPELLVGSSAMTGTGEMQLGGGATLYVTSSRGGVANRLCSTPVTAGGMYAVGLDLGRVARARVARSAAQFTGPLDVVRSGGQTPPVTPGDSLGGLLHAGALLYFEQVDRSQDMLASSLGVRRYRELSGLVTGTGMETVAALGVPTAVGCPGLFFDVGSDVSSRVSTSVESAQALVACNLSSGAMSSFIEGWLWHALLGVRDQGVSAAAALQQCLEAGNPIAAVDSNNVDDVLSGVDVPPDVASDIRSQVAAGRVVSLPTTQVQSGAWRGVGYVVVDPITGDAGYMLTGGIAGGYSGWDDAEQGLWVALGAVSTVGALTETLNGLGLAAAVYNVSVLSMGLSLVGALEVVNRVKDASTRSRMTAELAGHFAVAFAATTTFFTLGVMAAAGVFAQGPIIGAVCALGSLAVSFYFWQYTEWLKVESEGLR